MDSDDLKQYRIDRLTAAVQRCCAGNRSEFGRLLGYKDGAFVRQMLAGSRPVTEKTVRQIEEIPGLRGWFEDDNGAADESTEVASISSSEAAIRIAGAVVVPLLANSGSMGPGSEVAHDDVVVGKLTLSPAWVTSRIKPLTRPENLRFIHGYGDSMEPTFFDGDVMLVDTGVNTADVDGVYVLEANNRIYIKRVRQTLGGEYQVSSDNVTVKTIDVLDGKNTVEVKGKVVWVWNGRKI